MIIKLGKTSKLGKDVVTFGLPAGKTCPGAIENGKMSQVCQGCYAKGGHYRFGVVKQARERNLKQTKAPKFISSMVQAIDKSGAKYMRWFDSGDIYDKTFAYIVECVCKDTPNVKHWIASRALALPCWQEVRKRFDKLPNVMVRASYGSLDAKYDKKVHTAIVVPHDVKLPKGAHLCMATETHGQCGECKKCWEKSCKMVCYRPHGQRMSKIVKERVK